MNKTLQFKRNSNICENYSKAIEKMQQISNELADGEVVLIRYYDTTETVNGSHPIKTVTAYKQNIQGSTNNVVTQDDKLNSNLKLTKQHGLKDAGYVFSAGTSIETMLRALLSETVEPSNATAETITLSLAENYTSPTCFYGGSRQLSSVTASATRKITSHTVELVDGNYVDVAKVDDIPTGFTYNLKAASISGGAYSSAVTISDSGKTITWVLDPPITVSGFDGPSFNCVVSGNVTNNSQITRISYDSDDAVKYTHTFNGGSKTATKSVAQETTYRMYFGWGTFANGYLVEPNESTEVTPLFSPSNPNKYYSALTNSLVSGVTWSVSDPYHTNVDTRQVEGGLYAYMLLPYHPTVFANITQLKVNYKNALGADGFTDTLHRVEDNLHNAYTYVNPNYPNEDVRYILFLPEKKLNNTSPIQNGIFTNKLD